MLYGRQANWLDRPWSYLLSQRRAQPNKAVNQAVCSCLKHQTITTPVVSVFLQQITWIIWSSLTGN